MKKLSIFLPIFLTIVLAFSIIPQTSAATDIIYSDLSDGYARPGYAASGFTYLIVGDVDPDLYSQAFLKFNIDGISDTIGSATLYIYVYTSWRDYTEDNISPLDNPGLGDCIVRHIADFETVGTEDLNSPSIGNDPGTLIASGINPNIGYVSIDVTAAMQDDINNGRSWSTFMIKMSIDTDNDGKRDLFEFYSSDISGTEQDPYIEYSFISPVGGIYSPMNKLDILAPYIALVGLIGAISTIFAIRRWRKD